MDISLVIPAFEDSKKIAADIKAASDFLAANGLTGEIIVVDDGSKDGTAHVAEKTGEDLPAGMSLEVVRLPQHRGKGCAVRTGIARSTGEYVMFADSGCCISYDNILDGLELLKSGNCDIAHGSRKLPQSSIQRAQPVHRRVFARRFRWFMNTMLTMPQGLTDTQCGFKIYRGDVARQLYGRCTSDGFMFDVEIILRAQKAGYRVTEFPVEWTCDPDSRLSVARTPWPVLRELIKIRRNLTKEQSDNSSD